MIEFLHKLIITEKLIFITTHFEKISKNKRYGYAKVSSKEQAETSLNANLKY